MPPLKSLTADRLRELARTGAEVTLNRLRAEIIAIERAFPELRLAQGRRAARRSIKGGNHPHAHDVGGGAEGSVCADETILGRAAEGAGENEIAQ